MMVSAVLTRNVHWTVHLLQFIFYLVFSVLRIRQYVAFRQHHASKFVRIGRAPLLNHAVYDCMPMQRREHDGELLRFKVCQDWRLGAERPHLCVYGVANDQG